MLPFTEKSDLVIIKGKNIWVYTKPGVTFAPNQTTAVIYSSVFLEPHDIIIELGAGVGPGTLYLGSQENAQEMYAIEIVPEQCELLRKNVRLSRLEKKVYVIEGNGLNALKQKHGEIKADVIVSDVSGMNDIGVELEWYPIGVPRGGADGTANIIPFLQEAPKFLNRDNTKARVYFPIVVNFSDKDKILNTTRANFTTLTKLAEVGIPLKQEQVAIIDSSKHKVFTPLIKKGSRSLWQLEVYEARNPIPITANQINFSSDNEIWQKFIR